MSDQQKIIVFSGSFDPPTLAHQAIVQACLNWPDIDEVWVMPTALREDKNIGASSDDRLAMLRHMKYEIFNDSARLRISDFELNLPVPTQTIQTVQALHAKYPDIQFLYAYGADSYQGMPTWEEGTYLQKTLPMLVAARSGYKLPDSSPRLQHLNLYIDTELADVSSTKVRHNIRHYIPLTELVCQSVDDYIMSHDLYA
jgi:nicotinate-nucleotide adenylyltransferase